MPFTGQLAGDGFVLDLRAAGGRRPRRSQPSPPPADPAPRPAILLVSRLADGEFDLVRRLLGAAGVPVIRLDAETAASAGLAVDLGRRSVRVDGRWITPTVTWVRHFSARAMPSAPGALRRIFTAQSWQALADQLTAIAAVPITARGPGLLAQLAMASTLSIAVPRTVVCTDAAAARDLLGTDRVVVKALHEHFVEARPGRLSGVFAQITDRAALGGRWGPGEPPVVVQEYVEHDMELRVYYLRGQIETFAIAKSDPAQLWLNPEPVTVTRIEPPQAIASATRSLATSMSLQYGAFDFLYADGLPVFLEVNLAGDWRWLEAKTGSAPVSTAVAAMLGDLHDAAAGGTSGRREPIDLTTFLAGGRPAYPS